ncbi:GntR family transcriptional regulator [Prauserella rugosa]|uniref:DNA-binding transcriptional regulator YhcF (GntR family) n=1 Tax=Prauserella rugosa TaxID=43354 RepID=A0A660CKJ2_9PSEU|nr:GntR family transcriptional regulator [Prauserella rugosa]KID32471.1 putative transcriptional regulator [Prauserella sp. Am3]TWH22169.1 DNA-binding transcriptional regulator YhcF (GntR family) [Prauserella rugosa]
MLIRIDPASQVPLFEQVAASVRRALSDGELAQGQQLPPAREVAASLDINVHTVLRAYGVLRDEGLIELRRRRGAVVTGTADTRARLNTLAGDLVDEARRVGVDVEELTNIVKEKYA